MWIITWVCKMKASKAHSTPLGQEKNRQRQSGMKHLWNLETIAIVLSYLNQFPPLMRFAHKHIAACFSHSINKMNYFNSSLHVVVAVVSILLNGKWSCCCSDKHFLLLFSHLRCCEIRKISDLVWFEENFMLVVAPYQLFIRYEAVRSSFLLPVLLWHTFTVLHFVNLNLARVHNPLTVTIHIQ